LALQLVMTDADSVHTFGINATARGGVKRRLSKDYECYVQTSETLLDIAAIRLMLNRVAPV